jgi:hypothetical protein
VLAPFCASNSSRVRGKPLLPSRRFVNSVRQDKQQCLTPWHASQLQAMHPLGNTSLFMGGLGKGSKVAAEALWVTTVKESFDFQVSMLPDWDSVSEQASPLRRQFHQAPAPVSGATITLTRPRRSNSFSPAVKVVRSITSSDATAAIPGGFGWFSNISSENCPLVRSSGRSAPSKRRASARAARCT